AQVKTNANLKGLYVQGCITSHDLNRSMENVHELNPTELSEPIKPKTDESLNKSKTEANSVTKIEEAEYEEESNNPKPIKN
ncbi:hypothetical protein J1N35_005386, partial [Gossypium stocksii]